MLDPPLSAVLAPAPSLAVLETFPVKGAGAPSAIQWQSISARPLLVLRRQRWHATQNTPRTRYRSDQSAVAVPCQSGGLSGIASYLKAFGFLVVYPLYRLQVV